MPGGIINTKEAYCEFCGKEIVKWPDEPWFTNDMNADEICSDSKYGKHRPDKNNPMLDTKPIRNKMICSVCDAECGPGYCIVCGHYNS